MKILALDTATEACSAALYVDGEISSRFQLAPREHSRLILKMIDSLLQESDTELQALDAIAFGRGPGSFMGIRIAAGVVQGLAFAHDIPVIPVSNLMAIAEVAFEQTGETRVLTAIDARMTEVYWAALERGQNGQWLTSIAETVCAPDKLVYPDKGKWLAAGTGWGSYAALMQADTDITICDTLADCLPSASAIVSIAVQEYRQGNTVKAAQAQPVYLRNDVAKKPRQKSFAKHLNMKSGK